MQRSLTITRVGAILALTGALALGVMATGRAQTGPDAFTDLPAGNENSIVIAQNFGIAAADVVMDVYTPGGVLVQGASRAVYGVAPGGIAQFPQATNTGLQAGFRGVGVISSNQPINALLVRDILRSASTNAKSYSLANATSEGGHKLAAPIMFNKLQSGGRWWNSRASVVNTGTSVACVRVTYTLLQTTGAAGQTVVANGPGGSGCAQGFPIAPGAQVTFGPKTSDTTFPAGTLNSQLSALIEVLNPSANNKIAAVVDIYRSDGHRLLGSYNGLVYNPDSPTTDEVGNNVVAPIAMKSNSGFYTVVNVMNLDRSAPANVQIQYTGRLNDGTGATFNHTVNLGSVAEGAFHSTYQTEAIPIGFIGTARVVANRPVGVTVIRGKQTFPFSGVNDPGYAAVNGVPQDKAATKWRSPIYFRRYAPGAPPTRGYNSWVQVQVADGSTANVTLRYVGDPTSGCPVGPYTLNTTVTNNKIFLANLDSSPDNGFPANAPNCFFGGVEVTANKPIIVISQVGADKFPGGDSEGVTNAFPE